MKVLSLLKYFPNIEAPDDYQDRLDQFQKVYRDYHNYVRSTLFWMVPQSDLNDMVQEVFVKVWKNQNRFRERSSIKTWIYRITINLAYDFHRKNKNLLGEDELKPDYQPDGIDHDLKDLIKKGIEILDSKKKSVFVLFYKQDLSVEEVSKILKLPKGTVKSRLFHARSEFVEFLKKQGVSYEQL